MSERGCGLCPGGRLCTPGVRWQQNVMLCLQCRRWQPKGFWSPAQWKSLQPVLLDLQRNCCSQCSPDWWSSAAPASSPTSTPTESPTSSDDGHKPTPTRGWTQTLLVILGADSTDQLLQRTYRLATLGSRIQDFMFYWVDSMGRHQRKRLSYDGALRWRQGMEGICATRGDWTDPISMVKYFDPGNEIYSRAFHLAFPEIASSTKWNKETQGDIFEGLLALKCMDDYGALRKYPGYPHFPPRHAAARIADWIEELVTLVWGVSLIYPESTDSPAEWAHRWRAQV